MNHPRRLEKTRRFRMRRHGGGFAFIDFASRAEAQAAFGALQHSHLYGRRLVIEPCRGRGFGRLAVGVGGSGAC